MDVHQQHFHKQPSAADTWRAHKSSCRDTDVKGIELLVPALRRTVGQVCIRISACSCKDSTPLSSVMWLLVCRQNSKPAWLVLKAGTRLEEQKRAASWQWITHDYGLIIGWFLSFFSCFFFYFSTVAVIVWVWVLFVIYLFIEAHCGE